MPKNRSFIHLVVALATATVSVAYATDDPPTSAEANISGNVKIAAAAAKRDAKVVETAVKEGAEKVGVEAKKVAHVVTDATKKGAHEVKVAAKDVAAKTRTSVGDTADLERRPPQ
jgi:hypothetical protein